MSRSKELLKGRKTATRTLNAVLGIVVVIALGSSAYASHVCPIQGCFPAGFSQQSSAGEASGERYCLINWCMDRYGVSLCWLDCHTMWVFEERVDLVVGSIYVLGHEGEALIVADQDGGNKAAGTRVRKQMQAIK